MSTLSENFALRFVIVAVLLVANANAQLNYYVANGTLMSLTVGNTYGLFNITGDQLNEKVIKYGQNTNVTDQLQNINAVGYVNGVEDSNSQPLCTVLKRTGASNIDYALGYVTTTHLLDGADHCPLPSQDSFLISRGFTRIFGLSSDNQVSCNEPWNYRLVLKQGEEMVLEAVFQMDMKPLYTCMSQ